MIYLSSAQPVVFAVELKGWLSGLRSLLTRGIMLFGCPQTFCPRASFIQKNESKIQKSINYQLIVFAELFFFLFFYLRQRHFLNGLTI